MIVFLFCSLFCFLLIIFYTIQYNTIQCFELLLTLLYITSYDSLQNYPYKLQIKRTLQITNWENATCKKEITTILISVRLFMCAKNSLCYYFLKWQWLWSKCTKAKNRQKVQGIAGLLERYAQIKLNIPISWEKQFLHWSQYHKLISSIVRNLLPLVRFLFFYSSRYNTWLRGRRS